MVNEKDVMPALRRFVTVGQAMGFDVEFDGTAPQWVVENCGRKAVLSMRGKRQALPSGSTPLNAWGGTSISGRFFTADEVEEFFHCGVDGIIFEREI